MPGTAMFAPGQAFWPLLRLPGWQQRGPGHSNAQAYKLRPALSSLRKDVRSLVVAAADLQDQLDALRASQRTLTGRWHKDREASDDMSEACEMVQLAWVLRKAVAVLNTLELEETEEHFSTNLKAGGIMDVVERYPWRGDAVEHPRRDKRRGRHSAYVERTPAGPRIVCTWGDPHGGECSDTFTLSEDGSTLTQLTEMRIRSTGRSTAYRTVFRRARA